MNEREWETHKGWIDGNEDGRSEDPNEGERKWRKWTGTSGWGNGWVARWVEVREGRGMGGMAREGVEGWRNGG